MQKLVLVRWKTKGAVMGQRRNPGDQDIMPSANARWLRASGMVDVLGQADKVVPRVEIDVEDAP